MFEEGLSEDRTIPVSLERMYEVITDFGERVELDRTAHVHTKYKTVDRKVRPMAAPLLEGSELRIKGVASDPKSTGSGRHRTPIHQHNATGAQGWWGWLSTAGGGGTVSEDAREAWEGLPILAGRLLSRWLSSRYRTCHGISN